MARLEDIISGCAIKGILPDEFVTVIQVDWMGTVAVNLTYRESNGKLGNELVYRNRESEIEILHAGKPCSFDGDPSLFRLVSEALRISLAYLFDPLLAVNTSRVEPLPHQITAVYEEMIPRQPLRFLLADDPGAGKTIMAGLFIKELIIRGDLQRCLIVCPGNLVEQWQDELYRRFHLPFEIMTNDKFESARTGNWFNENQLVICRLDKLSRNEDVNDKLKSTDWDLIVCDEAHKMSASYSGGEIHRTKRHQLGMILSTLTRHFLLLTATPHNGKEEDFQLFMSLLDNDRFEGKFRNGVHSVDASDLMRRMIKEDLVKFDGKPLFPERRAYTVEYQLSDIEADLYLRVTEYVRQEFNRAEQLNNNGRRGTIGFALTILQRRLASSPEAIYQSLKRRREKLEKLCREADACKSSTDVNFNWNKEIISLSEDELDDMEDAPEEEIEAREEQIVDLASAARTIMELRAEIATLQSLENLAKKVRDSGCDRKWKELSQLLMNQTEMFDAQGYRRKLIIFSEHRDTLNYLRNKISDLIQNPDTVITIHGGLGREERRKAQLMFTQDRTIQVLVATDAAGEGINLQRAHLMVNYDLPWNPNRLEQRFGRIHRIGQTEVCHCWNLVASETREGDVYRRLLEKLEFEREALGGKVFDILGKLVFNDKPLRQLLLEAIRYGDQPEVKDRLNQVIDETLDRDKLRALIEDHALAHDSMDSTRIQSIREDMERAEARKLQPHFIASFFIEAFKRLGGVLQVKELNRFEIKHVPVLIRNHARKIGVYDPILTQYERITFEKDCIDVTGKPSADFVCPGHPLLDVVIDIVIEQNRDLLKRGAILVDENDFSEEIQALVYLEHSIQDARTDKNHNRLIASKQVQFVKVGLDGKVSAAGYAPYLDYRPLTDVEKSALEDNVNIEQFMDIIESQAINYTVMNLVPMHLQEVKNQREKLIDKTVEAVKTRLQSEIRYWNHRYEQLKEHELAGKTNAKLNSNKAKSRAEDLENRMQRRLEELSLERKVSPLPPNVIGAALIIPIGLLLKLGINGVKPRLFAKDTAQIELIAMKTIMDVEIELGFIPNDVSSSKCGYDIESKAPDLSEHLRFIEVKGRLKGAETVTITKNEILTALNKPDQYILAIVEVEGSSVTPHYIRRPFTKEPDFEVTSVNYKLSELAKKWGKPS